jgi:serine/threonine protein phosphatase PrpC
MERRGGGGSSDSGGGSGPGRKPSWYERCFPIRKELRPLQPSEEALRNSQERQRLSDQTPLTSHDQRGGIPTSDYQRGDIGRSGDDTLRNSRTTREAGHGEGTQEHTNLKQLVNNRLKELEETSGQTDRLLSEIQKACDELRGPNDIDQLADKIVNVSNAVSTDICERSQTLQSAYKKFERDGEGLEEIGRYSQEVHKSVQQTIGERFLRLQDDCNELRETKDLLKTLRDFPHIWKQIDEAKADLSKSAEENTKINELSNRIIEKVENSRNKLHDKIVNVSESNIKEFLDNSWRLQGAWDKLKEDVNQLETLRKASREWKEARQIKEEFIGTLSEERKGTAGMRAEMADTAFELFLSYFEQKDTRQRDKARLEKACEQLKGIVKADLYDKWHDLANFRNKNHMQIPTETSYEQLYSSVEREKFAEARKHVGQLAENTLQSYEFKLEGVKPSRRTQAVDQLRKLLRITRDHRPGRVNKVAGEFNKTLGEMKGKLPAVPEEVKDKLVEKTIAIMKDFKESYDDALRGYGKRKGRTAREAGERKITKLNDQFKTLNDAVSIYKQLHEVQAKDIEDLWDSNKDSANKVVKDADRAFMQMLNREENWQSLKKGIENAFRRLADIVEPKIVSKENEKGTINKRSKDSSGAIIDETHEISMNIESLIITQKGDIKEIASATRGEHTPNEDSCFIFKDGGGVCDGVSQGGRGAEASRMAKGFFERELPKLSDKIKREKLSPEQIEAELKEITLEIDKKIDNEINVNINNKAEKAKTTLSAAISIGDGKMMAVNVGDSRVYVLTTDGEIKHITRDDGPFESEQWYEYQVKYNILDVVDVNKQEQKEIQEKIANMSDNEIMEIKTRITNDQSSIKDMMNNYNLAESDEVQAKIKEDINNILNDKKLEDIKLEFAIQNGYAVTLSLGTGDVEPNDIESNVVTFPVNPGDRIIITSDGVHDNLSDQEIIDSISNSRTAEEAAQALVKTALEKSLDETRSRRKPGDDTTAVVVECSGEGRNNVQTSDRVTVQPQPGHEASTSRGQGTSSKIEEV